MFVYKLNVKLEGKIVDTILLWHDQKMSQADFQHYCKKALSKTSAPDEFNVEEILKELSNSKFHRVEALHECTLD